MHKDLSDAIAYFRVSTQKQFEEYHSFASYYTRFKQYGFRDDQIYSDVDSGANNYRKGYLLVLDAVRSGKVKRVFVPDFSRFTRSPGGWEDAMRDFQINGASLITLDGLTMNFDSPEEKMIARQQAIFAALERERNQWRSLKGHEFLRMEGRALRPCFGYTKENDRFIPNRNLYRHTDKTVWEIARELVETFLSCGNYSETIRIVVLKYKVEGKKRIDLNDFPRVQSGLKDWLMSATVRGHTEYFGSRKYKYMNQEKKANHHKIIHNTHEPLITLEMDLQLQRILSVTKTRKHIETVKNTVQGLAFCICGSPMKLRESTSRPGIKGKKYYYMVCKSAYPNNAYTRSQQEMGVIERCSLRSSYGLTLEKTEVIVIQSLCDAVEGISRSVNSLSFVRDEPIEIVELRKQIANYESLAKDDPDLLPVLNKKRRDLENKLMEQSLTDDTEQLREKLLEYGKDPDFWYSTTKEERILLYQDFIDRVVFDRGVPTVYLKV